MVDTATPPAVPDSLPDHYGEQLRELDTTSLGDLRGFIDDLIEHRRRLGGIHGTSAEERCSRCEWKGSGEELQREKWRVKCPECEWVIADARA